MNKQEIATELYKKVREEQLSAFRSRMPEGKQGVEFVFNGTKYVAAIRRLTPKECSRLQTVPEDYEFCT